MARTLNSKNKKGLAFREALQKYANSKGVDPHMWMVDLLCKKGRIPLELKFQVAKELAQYLQPKLRAIELQGDVTHLHILDDIQGMSDVELEAFVTILRAQRMEHVDR